MAGNSFVTGGAASGKSCWAVSQFKNCGEVLYICTGDRPSAEIAQKMEYSSDNEGVNWTVHSAKRNLAAAVTGDCSHYVFDNLPEYVQNLILTVCHDPDHITDEQIGEIRVKAVTEMEQLFAAVEKAGGDIMVISLETGFSLRSHLRAERVFSDILSTLNRMAAQKCENVYLSVSGVQVKIR